MFSGGKGSWAAAKRVVAEHGPANVKLLFADTLIEDDDLYRFLIEAGCNVFGSNRAKQFLFLVRNLPPLDQMEARKKRLAQARDIINKNLPFFAWIAEGRTPWEVFFQGRFLGNSRIDPCSKILKRQVCDKWLTEHYTAENVTVYVGIDWTEEERYTVLKERKKPWVYRAPLCEPPLIFPRDIPKELARQKIKLPRLYQMGFPHNNCGGYCVKAGKAHFKRLWETMPDRYKYHESMEGAFQEFIGKDVTILREQRQNVKYNLSMREFRERLETEAEEVSPTDWGSCGCFLAKEDET